MKILLIDNGTLYTHQLLNLLKDHDVKMVDWDKLSTEGGVDLIILSGGHTFSIKNHPFYYKREIEFIRKNDKPVLGICIGAELIAYTFGAQLEMLIKREKGIIELEILKNGPLFTDIKTLKVYESHRWVIKKLPAILIGLARSVDGYEIIKHKEKPFYGFQFHPEMFVNKTCGRNIFNNLINIIKNFQTHCTV